MHANNLHILSSFDSITRNIFTMVCTSHLYIRQNYTEVQNLLPAVQIYMHQTLDSKHATNS